MTPKSGSPLSTPIEVTPTFATIGRTQSAGCAPAPSSTATAAHGGRSSSSGFPHYRNQNQNPSHAATGSSLSGGVRVGLQRLTVNNASNNRPRMSAATQNPSKRRKIGTSDSRSSASHSNASATTKRTAHPSASTSGSTSSSSSSHSSSSDKRQNFTSPTSRRRRPPPPRAGAPKVSPNENLPPFSPSRGHKQLAMTGSPGLSRLVSRHKRTVGAVAAHAKAKPKEQSTLMTFQTSIPETPPRLDRTRSVFARGNKAASGHGVSKLMLSPDSSKDGLNATPPNRAKKPSIKRAQSMLLVPSHSKAPPLSQKSNITTLPVEVPDSMDPPSPQVQRTKSGLTEPDPPISRLGSPPGMSVSVSRGSSRSAPSLALHNENSTGRFAAVFGRTLSGGTTQIVNSAAAASTPVLRETSSEALVLPGQGTTGTTLSMVGSTASRNSYVFFFSFPTFGFFPFQMRLFLCVRTIIIIWSRVYSAKPRSWMYSIICQR